MGTVFDKAAVLLLCRVANWWTISNKFPEIFSGTFVFGIIGIFAKFAISELHKGTYSLTFFDMLSSLK